jgi:hypothetical protein
MAWYFDILAFVLCLLSFSLGLCLVPRVSVLSLSVSLVALCVFLRDLFALCCVASGLLDLAVCSWPGFLFYLDLSWALGELQQRAIEYSALPNIGADLMYTVLDTMPAFAEVGRVRVRVRGRGRGRGLGRGRDLSLSLGPILNFFILQDKESPLEKRIKEKESEKGFCPSFLVSFFLCFVCGLCLLSSLYLIGSFLAILFYLLLSLAFAPFRQCGRRRRGRWHTSGSLLKSRGWAKPGI